MSFDQTSAPRRTEAKKSGECRLVGPAINSDKWVEHAKSKQPPYFLINFGNLPAVFSASLFFGNLSRLAFRELSYERSESINFVATFFLFLEFLFFVSLQEMAEKQNKQA